MTRRIQCSQVWGGNQSIDEAVETGALRASLYSRAADGGKGGDIYYFSVCGGDQLSRIAVADVMGHGESVSHVSDLVYDALRENIQNPFGQDIMFGLNGALENHGSAAMTTAAIASLVVKNGQVLFAYAGHPPIMVWRSAEKTWTELALPHTKGCNVPLGIMADACFDQNDLALQPGDKLFIYTDGVTEAPDAAGQHFGLVGLRTALQAAGNDAPTHVKQSVLDHLHDFSGGRLNHDDITFMTIEAFPFAS